MGRKKRDRDKNREKLFEIVLIKHRKNKRKIGFQIGTFPTNYSS